MLFVSCEKKSVSLIIKTGVDPFATTIDNDVHSAYDFLGKVVDDFEKNYSEDKVSIQLFQYESQRRKNEVDDCFGTSFSPDILFASQFNLSNYVHTGYIVPLDDIITTKMRDDISFDIWENCKINDKTYMIPFVTAQNVMCFNKRLFRNAGLDRFCNTDEVQTWTISEWNNILSSLSKKLPKATYPMMMYAADEQGDTHLMLLLRIFGCPFFDESGNVCIETNEGIAALDWLRSSYKNGFFPPHPELLVIMDNSELFTSEQLAIYLANASIQVYFDDAGIDCGYVNFPSTGAVGLNTSFDMSFCIVDNGDADKIKVAKAFIKYIYESHWLDYSAGAIPVSRKVREKYAENLKTVSRYINNDGINVNFSNNSPNWHGVRAVFYKHIQELWTTNKSTSQIARELDADCNASIAKGREKSFPHK